MVDDCGTQPLDHWWTECKTCGWKRHSGVFSGNADLKRSAHMVKNPTHLVEIYNES